MSADLSQVWAVVKQRAGIVSDLPFLWPNEPNELPDTPSPFAYGEIVVDKPGAPAGFGGGRGSNLYRTAGELAFYVFTERNYGTERGAALAERVAAAFRSYRDDVISCFGAAVMPSADGASMVPRGFESAASQYEVTTVVIDFSFDQIG